MLAALYYAMAGAVTVGLAVIVAGVAKWAFEPLDGDA